MLTRYFLKFILLSNEISSGFLRDISATELIAADPDNRLLPVLKWHLLYSIGDVQPVTYLVAVMAINDDVIPCDDRLSAAVYCKIYFELKILILLLPQSGVGITYPPSLKESHTTSHTLKERVFLLRPQLSSDPLRKMNLH